MPLSEYVVAQSRSGAGAKFHIKISFANHWAGCFLNQQAPNINMSFACGKTGLNKLISSVT